VTSRFSIAFPEELRIIDWLLSPNGDMIAYAGRPKNDPEGEPALYLRSFGDYSSRKVEGSEGIRAYIFSPDGNWLAMRVPVAPRATKTRLSKVPVDGSAPPLALIDWQDDWGGNFLWLPDGDLIMSTSGEESLIRVPLDGGAPGDPVKIQLEREGSSFYLQMRNPSVLPDGHHVLGFVIEYSQRGYETHVGLIDVDTGEASVVVENGSSSTWLSTGHLIFTRGDAVLAVAFDQDRLQTTGETVAVEAGFRALAGWGDTEFCLSADGTLVHWPGGIFGNKRKIVITDYVDGRLQVVEPWSEELRQYEAQLEVSLDGRRLAINVTNDAGTYDIWSSDMDRPRLSRFIHQPGRDCLPGFWTRDGESLAYQCSTTEENTVYLARVDASEEPRQLVAARFPESYWPALIFPDDSTLVLNHTVGDETHLELLPLDAGDPSAAPQRWLDNAWDPSISPDGRWLAYESDVSGRQEIYLRAIHPDRSLGRDIPVTTNGADDPWWDPRRKGSPLQLRFSERTRQFTIDVVTDPELKLSRPKLLGDFEELAQKSAFGDHLPDGRYLDVMKGEEETPPDRVNVVLNWTTELERRMGR
jgi:serine/threonine-protein kinase